MNPLYGIFIFCVLQTVYSQDDPEISYMSAPKRRNIGGSVDFVCSVRNVIENNYQLLWIKRNHRGDQSVIFIGNERFNDGDLRFSSNFDSVYSSYILQITDIQESDEGTYKCLIMISSVKNITAQTDLILVDGITKISYVSPKQMKNSGDTVELECSTNRPHQSIMWTKDNQLLSFYTPAVGVVSFMSKRFSSFIDGSTLTFQIRNANKIDAGLYKCLVNDLLHKTHSDSPSRYDIYASASVDLEIRKGNLQKTPKIEISQYQKVNIQDDVEFKCLVEHYGEYPTVEWYKLCNNQSSETLIGIDSTLCLRDRRYQLEFEENMYSSSYMFKINNATESDAGIYRCNVIVSNTTSTSLETELEVQAPPRIVYMTPAISKDIGETVEFICRVKYDHFYTVKWYKYDVNADLEEPIFDHYKREEDPALPEYKFLAKSYTLQIKNLEMRHAGIYRCAVFVSGKKRVFADSTLKILVPHWMG